uniref:Uncharacterized protein n=1 Tax=Romanomermis culicivorax TaxID=13658 RepID=A0A915JSN7_ROMCU
MSTIVKGDEDAGARTRAHMMQGHLDTDIRKSFEKHRNSSNYKAFPEISRKNLEIFGKTVQLFRLETKEHAEKRLEKDFSEKRQNCLFFTQNAHPSLRGLVLQRTLKLQWPHGSGNSIPVGLGNKTSLVCTPKWQWLRTSCVTFLSGNFPTVNSGRLLETIHIGHSIGKSSQRIAPVIAEMRLIGAIFQSDAQRIPTAAEFGMFVRRANVGVLVARFHLRVQREATFGRAARPFAATDLKKRTVGREKKLVAPSSGSACDPLTDTWQAPAKSLRISAKLVQRVHFSVQGVQSA